MRVTEEASVTKRQTQETEDGEVIGGTTSWEDKRPQRGYGFHLPEAPNKWGGYRGVVMVT